MAQIEFTEKMLSFRPDAGLLYLIQQVTKKPTDEILGFFYDFGKEVFIIGVQNMAGRSIRKDIQAMYPGTAIPFKILVKGQKSHRAWNQATGQYINKDSYSGTLEVTFPDNPTYMDTEKLMDVIMEKALLGGSHLPDFEAPKSRTPKLYKDLIEQILKGPSDGTTLHDSGHSRETGSPEETVE